MVDEEKQQVTVAEDGSDTENKTSSALTVNTVSLNEESLALINQIIAEKDIEKTKDLTYLFNINQDKKTMVRMNKLNDLMDAITDQAYIRFTERPDEISNDDLVKTMKTVQDMIERGQKQVSGVGDSPLIQINQQTNEVNVGDSAAKLSRDSRKKVENVISSLLKGLGATQQETEEPINVEGQCNDEEIVDDN